MKIVSKIKTYTLDVIHDVWSRRQDILGRVKHRRPVYFIDEELWRLHEPRLRAFVQQDPYFLIKADERNKEYGRCADFFGDLIELGMTRNDVLVTFGGGILQDISGFVASTLYRGVPWIFIPTTLLAQADSCIGSKTSMNFADHKNLIGTFYPPDAIFIDVHLIRTLPPADFNSGLGEVIKFHLLSDEDHYRLLRRYLSESDLRQTPLLADIIGSTLAIKKSYFEQDEFDTGIRNLLNYGHCFGHALEAATSFGVAHGEAVIVGMGFADLISRQRGLMPRQTFDEFEAIFRRFYPHFDLGGVNVEDLIHHMKRDKKRAGHGLTMILGKGLGDFAKYDDIQEQEIRDAFAEFKSTHLDLGHQHSGQAHAQTMKGCAETDVPQILVNDGVMQADFTHENLPLSHLKGIIASKDNTRSWCQRVINTENNSATLISQMPGEGNRLHYHPNWNEWWYIVAGTWQWEIEGKEMTVKEGDIVFIPKGKLHRITATGNKPAVRLAVSKDKVPHIYPERSA